MTDRPASGEPLAGEAADAPLLEMCDISKTFPGVQALDRVTLRLGAATVHGLLGVNGAGKSTLMNILGGLVKPDAGQIRMRGKVVSIESPRDAAAHGIAVVHQEVSLWLDLDLATNVCADALPHRFGVLSTSTMQRQAREALGAVGLRARTSTRVRNLRPSERQLVEIAKGLVQGADIFVLDEPTSSLTRPEVDTLFGLIRSLTERGVGIIFLSHRLDEVEEICDEVTVLHDSRNAGTLAAAEVDQRTIVRMMLGHELGDPSESEWRRGADAEQSPEVVLRARGLTRPPGYEDISFELHKGELLGVTGLLGSGRTELMRSLFGLDRPQSGTIEIDGAPVQLRNPRDAIRAGVALLTEDRRGEGLLLEGAVGQNLSLVALRSFAWMGLMRPRRERKGAREMIEALKIRVSGLAQRVATLSGGNQQKVVLGKWLQADPKILLLDEPTRGIDVAGKEQIYRIIDDLTRRGTSVIIVSSEVNELVGLCHRTLVLRQGRLIGEFPANTPAKELLYASSSGV